MMKNNATTIPLYIRVYEELKRQIQSGKYKTDDYLPSEQELQKMFDVSRITVRRSLQDLALDGYVERIRGKGTKVLQRKKYSDLYRLSGFTEDAIKAGERPTSIVLKCITVKASAQVAEFLQIKPNENVYFLRRLRLINGRVHAIHETYISQRFNLKLDASDFDENTSLYEMYDNNNIQLGEATETIGAIKPSQTLKKELFIDQDTPVFLRERITYDVNQVPIEFSKNYYIAKGYRYVVRLHKDE